MNFRKHLLACVVVILCFVQTTSAEVHRRTFKARPSYLVIEVLDDDLIHVEVSANGNAPSEDQAIYTSPMVLKSDYQGPRSLVDRDNVI